MIVISLSVRDVNRRRLECSDGEVGETSGRWKVCI